MNLQKKGVKRIAVNVLIITKKTQKGDPAMKIIILSTLFLLFLLMTAAIYLCIFYEVIRLASSSYAAANNLKFGKYLRILRKVYIVVCLMFLVAVFL